MWHSLRFRLIAVTTVLPMVTIAAAGLLIRDANAETFRAGPAFSYAGSTGQMSVGGVRVDAGPPAGTETVGRDGPSVQVIGDRVCPT